MSRLLAAALIAICAACTNGPPEPYCDEMRVPSCTGGLVAACGEDAHTERTARGGCVLRDGEPAYCYTGNPDPVCPEGMPIVCLDPTCD